MPFPTVEEVRQAVEGAIQRYLAASSHDWIAELDNNREISFRPRKEGLVELDFCLDDDELETLPEDQEPEKRYRFRVKVEALPYQGE